MVQRVSIRLHRWQMTAAGISIDLQRETEEKARQPETKLGAIAQTRHTARHATQSEDKPDTPNPHTRRETGLNNLSRGPGETAHQSPAGGTRRNVRARPTQGRVAPAKGNAKLPERPRDEGGPREARPASLHGSAKSPSSVRARAPRRPKDSTDIGTKGRAEDTCLGVHIGTRTCSEKGPAAARTARATTTSLIILPVLRTAPNATFVLYT
jgi:hypothetical protein